MRDEERLARALYARLPEARIEGEGVHWSVEANNATRRCEVDCFWYGDAAALMLGMNPRNARASGGPRYRVRTGAEYLVTLYAAGERIAGGRTSNEADAAAALRAWLADQPLVEIERAWPFIDAKRRRMRSLAASINAACGEVARAVVEANVMLELWVYGNGRSCGLHPSDEEDTVGCAFRLGPAQVAYGDVTSDAPSAIGRWMRGATLAELATAGVVVEPHAELLERGEVARWHWAHTRERIADPDDVLARSRPLLERLAQSPIATQFFSFSSLDRFCFSASSHFPWVDKGLPMINPPYAGRGYVVDIGTSRTECTLDRAVELVEHTLAAYPIRPLFGSAVDLAIAPLDTELAAQGSALHARLVQRCQWFDATVAAGARRAVLGSELRSVVFHDEADTHLRARYHDLAHAVTAIRRWLEQDWTLDELRLDPSVRDADIARDVVSD